jgi:outer membrane protein
MRTITRAALLALSLTLMAKSAQAQTVKLGYVNTEALMAQAPGRAAAESSYNKEVVAFQKQQKVWADSLNKQIENYQKVMPTLTDAKKKTEEDRLAKLQQDLTNLNNLGEQRIRQRENEVLAPLMEIVRAAIDEIRAEGGYAMIFSGDQNSPIVAADKNLDLTDKVVARLKTKAATAPTAPSAMTPSAVKKPPTR